jgi:hypothetical protein
MNETAQASTALWCMAYEITVPDGWEVVGFNDNAEDFGNMMLYADGSLLGAIRGDHYTGPILKKKAPEVEWVIPGDTDARHRPEVEVCNDGESWGKIKVLYGVTPDGAFMGSYGEMWKYCRMDAAQREKYEW